MCDKIIFPVANLDDNGDFITNMKFGEIIRLHEMLTDAEIPHQFRSLYDGWQVLYLCEAKEEFVADAVEHFCSYGSGEDLLEMAGLLTEEEKQEGVDVVGYITAEEVFERISKHWNTRPANDGQIRKSPD